MRRGKRRACVVGLDGVPVGLLKHLAVESVTPRIGEIIKGSGLRQMRAALPPVSSVSWTSFMTATNPGEHGIFGFTDVDQTNYQLRFPAFNDVAVPTFWDRLGEADLRCAIINQPATYPVRQLSGVLVSGFVALSLAKSVWPRKHLHPLEQMGYRIDVDTKQARENPDGLLDDLFATLALRKQAARYFWRQEEWDYFQLVITGADRLHHFLWRAVEERDDLRHTRAMDYYHAIDEFVGELWDWHHQRVSIDKEGEGFVILSDHGFTALRQEVRLNAWLHDHGYLEYRVESPTTIADITPGTRCFALDPGRIYLNVKERFARGCVEPENAPSLREELTTHLQALTFEGQPVISRILARESIYHGPKSDQGPDLIVLSNPGFDLKGTTKGKEIFTSSHFQGMHTADDALVWTLLPLPDDLEITDVGAAIYEWLSGN